MGDADALGGGGALKGVHGLGAVVGKAEEGALIRVAQADASIVGRLFDLLGGGELGVLVGDVLTALDAVGYMGMDRGVEVALAADVQAGVVVDVDELGAENAFTVVVIQGVPRHEQLQKLVAAGADGADLRDVVHAGIHRAEAGDATLDLALDEQVGGSDATLGAGVLPFRIADVVDHDAHDPVVAAALFAGQGIGVIVRHHAEAGVERLARGQGGGGHLRGRLTGSG